MVESVRTSNHVRTSHKTGGFGSEVHNSLVAHSLAQTGSAANATDGAKTLSGTGSFTSAAGI